MNKLILSLPLIFFFSTLVFGSEPAIWSVNSRADVLKGDARSVSVDHNGAITLAPKLTEVYRTDQPYIWSSAVDPSGNFYLGTGGDGKIFKVDAAGKGSLFTDLNELNVSAIVAGQSGSLFAGTSPDGKVYRVDSTGKAEVYFDPKEKYIWALAILKDGSLAVGTGEGGKIFRVRNAGASPEGSLLFDTSETNVISLAVDKQGDLVAGTDPGGLVLRFSANGKPFALLDSPLREIHELAIGPDGSVYALAIGDSASAPAQTGTPAPTSTPESKTVTIEKPNPLTPEQPQKSRYDLTGAKSAVYRILPDGGSDIIWASASVTGFSIHARQDGNGVLLGTSEKGRIYSIGNDAAETLVLQSDASQISTLRSYGQNVYATSSNQGSLYRFGSEPVAEGIYESAVFDAKASAAWGRIWWQSNGNVQIQTRSGNTERPDETWSAWAVVRTEAGSGSVPSPKAEYLQWRAVMHGPAAATSLSEVNVSFLARNIAPEVLSIQILPTNVGLAANPPIQIDPNIELSGLDPQLFGIPVTAVPPRRIYQRGARSVQWTAEDRNGDKLTYDIFYKEVNETAFRLLRADIVENFYTIDGQALADGRYVFRIVARDANSNPAGASMSGERISEPINIDNTQPTVSAYGTPQVTGDTARVVFLANDRSSFINRAEYSVNGGEWRTVFADDGISDSPDERYTIEIPVKTQGEYSLTLRAFDANGNAGNARVVVRR